MCEYKINMNMSFREVNIYYYEGENYIKISGEYSSFFKKYKITFYPLLNLKKWINLPGTEIDLDHQLEILYRLREWLKENKIKSNIDIPKKIKTSNQRCHWKNCTENKIESSAFCLKHFNLNLLVQ